MDIFGGIDGVEYSKDSLEGGILDITPQIIIRNVKTGLKLLNIILKQVLDRRENEFTQNLILTVNIYINLVEIRNGCC